ncbi:MAG: hypothetical protein AB7O24_00790 [Kofleriaceae bacterium]
MSPVRVTLIALVLAVGCKKPDTAASGGSGSAGSAAKPTAAEAGAGAPSLNPADPVPPAGACEGVATHIAGLITVLPIQDDKEPSHLEFFRKRMKSSLAVACEADKWNEPMRTCLLALKSLDMTGLTNCQDPVALESHKQRTADARSEYARRRLIATASGNPNVPLDPLPVPGCQPYIDVVNKWFRCEKTPVADRATMLTELEKIDPTFATKATTDEISNKCKKLEDALTKALTEMGC